MTIVEFLTARLDETEADANATTPVPVAGQWKAARDKHSADSAPLFLVQGEDPHDPGTTEYASTEIIVYSAEWQTEAEANLRHIARHDPARVLAEVKAKREIVRLHDPARNTGHTCANYVPGRPWDSGSFFGGTLSCPVLRYLAAPYADHPDYKQAWRVE